MADARERLGEAQHALLASLVAGADPPPGFDPARVRVQVSALVAKRRAEVARVRPDLPRALGERYPELFDAYAAGNPKPPTGTHADAEAFAEHALVRGDLPRPEPARRWLGLRRSHP